jgi:hypothetical protein
MVEYNHNETSQGKNLSSLFGFSFGKPFIIKKMRLAEAETEATTTVFFNLFQFLVFHFHYLPIF